MEGSRTRRNTTVSLRREFAGSRLEKQILVRAFALLVPVDGSEPFGEEAGKAAADRPPVIPARSQGGSQP
jgi:hypothetical protein